MASAQNLGGLPYQPGDTIRERKTGVDYVVQAVTSLAGLGFVVYAITVFGARVREFSLGMGESQDLLLVRRNVDRLPAEEVRGRIIGALRTGAKGEEALFQFLQGDEGRVWRDLLMLVDDAPSFAVKRGFLRLGELLVSGTGGVPDKAQIVRILQEIAKHSGGRYDDTFLDVLAGEIVDHAKKAWSRHPYLARQTPQKTSSKLLSDFFTGPQGGLEGSPFKFLRQFDTVGAFTTNPGATNIFNWRTRNVLKDLFLENPLFLEGHPDARLKEILKLSPQKRLEHLLRSAVTGSGHRYGEVLRDYLANPNRLDRAVRAAILGGYDPLLEILVNLDPFGIIESGRAGFVVSRTKFNKLFSDAMSGQVSAIDPLLVGEASKLERALSRSPEAFAEALAHEDLAAARAGRHLTTSQRLAIWSRWLDRHPNMNINHTFRTGRWQNRLGVVGEGARVIRAEPGALEGLISGRTVTFRGEVLSRSTIKRAGGLTRFMMVAGSLDRDEASANLLLNLNREIEGLEAQISKLSVSDRARGRLESQLNERVEELKSLFTRLSKGAQSSSMLFVPHSILADQGPVEVESLIAYQKARESQLSEEAIENIRVRLSNPRTKYSDVVFPSGDPRRVLLMKKADHWQPMPHYPLETDPNLTFVRFPGKKHEYQIMGTKLQVPIQEQLRRGRKLFSKKGARAVGILDIETAGDTITEIGMVFTEGDGFEFLVGKEKGKKEWSGIIKAAKIIEGMEAIGTHTGYDLDVLLKRAEALAAEPNIPASRRKALQEAAEIFRRAQEEKLFDTMTLLQATGEHPLGRTNLQSVMHHYNRGVEAHGGLADAAATLEILTSDIGERGIHWDLEVLESEYFARNKIGVVHTAADAAQGSLAVPVGLGTVETPQGVKFGLEMRELIPTEQGFRLGATRQVITSSPSELGGFFHFRQDVFPFSEGLSGEGSEELMQILRRQADTMSYRRINAYNPFSDLSMNVASESQLHAAERMLVDQKLIDALPQIQESLAEMQIGETGGAPEARTLFTQDIPPELSETQISQAIEDALDTAGFADNPRLAASFRSTAREALSNPLVAAQYNNAGVVANYLHSPAAKVLESLADDPEVYEYTYGYMMHQLTEKADRTKNLEDLARRIEVESPRLELKLSHGRQSWKATIDLLKGGPATYESKVSGLVADVMFATTYQNERGKAAAGILRRLGLTETEAELIRSSMSNFRSVNAARDALIANKLDPQRFPGVRDTFDRLLRSRVLKQMIADQVEENAKRGLSSAGLGADEVFGRELRQGAIGKTVSQQVAENTRKEAVYTRTAEDLQVMREEAARLNLQLRRVLDNDEVTAGGGLREVLETSFNDPETRERLSRIFSEDISVLNLENLTEEEAREAVQKARILKDQMKKRGYGYEEVSEDVKAALNYGKRRMNLLEYSSIPVRVFGGYSEGRAQIEIAHRRASEYQNSLHGGATGGDSAHKLHEMVNKARRAPVGSDEAIKAAHRKLLQTGIDLSSFSRVEAPLLALGGAVALLGGIAPDIKDRSASSEQSSLLKGPVARQSEIPGTAVEQTVWLGEAEPYKLDITFKGFVNSKREQEALLDKVYDAINSRIDVKSTNIALADVRSSNHRLAAREALRREV